jgi:hypothetical protein
MPAGGVVKCGSDLTDYYHFLLVPVWWQKYQALPPISADLVGQRGGGLVTPFLTTLCMGHTLAPMIAQAVHDTMLVDFLRRPVYYRWPVPSSTQKQFLRARDSCDTRVVKLGEVPVEVLKPIIEPAGFQPLAEGVQITSTGLPYGLADVEVPFSALALERVGCENMEFGVRAFDMRDTDVELAWRARGEERRMVRQIFSLYIDDADIVTGNVGVSRRLATAIGDRTMLLMLVVYARAGFVVKQSKLHFSSAEPSPTLGVVIDLSDCGRPEMYVDALKLSKLSARTREVVRQARAGNRVFSVRYLQHLVGSFVWAFLIRRPLLSVFTTIFGLIAKSGHNRRVVLRRKHQEELMLAVHLLPAAVARPAPPCPVVATYDASSYGYGAAYKADCPVEVFWEFASMHERSGSYGKFSVTEAGLPAEVRRRPFSCAERAAEFLRVDWEHDKNNGWKVARSAPFRDASPHINEKEAWIGEQMLAWFVAQPRLSLRKRLLLGGDSQVVTAVFARGRARSGKLNKFCQKVCALVVAGDVTAQWFWLRSSANPSDGPSRWAKTV